MKGLSRALVDPVVRERNLVAKQSWIGTRKALSDIFGARTANRHR